MRQQNSTLQLRVASGPRNGRERLRGHAQLSSVVRHRYGHNFWTGQFEAVSAVIVSSYRKNQCSSESS